ncbi:MAG: hypothetical protein NXI31_13945 [bacterium]|nr:hypothetical protein [bacterium]
MTAERHDEVRADLLIRLESGELDVDSPEVQAHLAADPAFEAEMHAFLALAHELGPGPDDDVLAEARASGEPWPGADRSVHELVTRELVDGERAEPASAPTGRPPLVVKLLLAAAAIWLGFFLWPATDVPPPAPPDLVLNSQGLWPHGQDVDRDQFRRRGFVWDDVPAGQYRVVITLPGREPIQSEWLSTKGWPATAVATELPEVIDWELQIRGGGRRESRYARAEFR